MPEQQPRASRRSVSSGTVAPVLGGSWDSESKVISTLIGVTNNYKYNYLNTKFHDPLGNPSPPFIEPLKIFISLVTLIKGFEPLSRP